MVRVFISYSHDSPEHSQRVRELADSLRRHGIDAELDQYQVRPKHGWPRWCENQLRPENNDFILVVCSAEYLRRSETDEPATTGSGVYAEASLIRSEIYFTRSLDRFIPILLAGGNVADIPGRLRESTHHRLTTFDLADAAFEALYRDLTGQPKVRKPALGAAVQLSEDRSLAVGSPLSRRPIRTMFQGQLEVVQITDLDDQRLDLQGALPIYDRLPDDERYEHDELIELTRRHLREEFGPAWKNYVLVARCAERIVGLLLCYDDVASNYCFVSCIAAEKPIVGAINVENVCGELVKALREVHARHGEPGREFRMLAEVDHPAFAANADERALRLSRLRLFGAVASLEGIDLRCFDFTFLQPRMNLAEVDCDRPLMLIYAGKPLPTPWSRDDVIRVLTWVYTGLYDGTYEDPDDAATFAAHARSLLDRVSRALPDTVGLLRIRDIVARCRAAERRPVPEEG